MHLFPNISYFFFEKCMSRGIESCPKCEHFIFSRKNHITRIGVWNLVKYSLGIWCSKFHHFIIRQIFIYDTLKSNTKIKIFQWKCIKKIFDNFFRKRIGMYHIYDSLFWCFPWCEKSGDNMRTLCPLRSNKYQPNMHKSLNNRHLFIVFRATHFYDMNTLWLGFFKHFLYWWWVMRKSIWNNDFEVSFCSWSKKKMNRWYPIGRLCHHTW